MSSQSGNLSSTERAVSGGVAAALALFAASRRAPLVRLLAGAAAAGLGMRAATGHCAVKAAIAGKALRRQQSASVDESSNESFPASDPPASRLPDEPPVNADAKWAAARAAGLD